MKRTNQTLYLRGFNTLSKENNVGVRWNSLLWKEKGSKENMQKEFIVWTRWYMFWIPEHNSILAFDDWYLPASQNPRYGKAIYCRFAWLFKYNFKFHISMWKVKWVNCGSTWHYSQRIWSFIFYVCKVMCSLIVFPYLCIFFTKCIKPLCLLLMYSYGSYSYGSFH